MSVDIPKRHQQKTPIRALADIPRIHAAKRPNHPALVFEGRVTHLASPAKIAVVDRPR